MNAYVIAEITVRNPEAMADYRAAAWAAIEEHGGRFLTRGAEAHQIEGERAETEQVVIIEFPSLAAARTWYSSPAYAKALAVKDAAMSRRLTFVEGAHRAAS